MVGYRGKTVDFERYSGHHRTTLGYFLNEGKWDDSQLEKLKRETVRAKIYNEAMDTGKPIYFIVDDSNSSVTAPSSQALHPIEAAYYHKSSLKKKQDYGHKNVTVLLSCNGITLEYATVLYDKSKTKIEIVEDILASLPIAPVASYLLCDCWYTSAKLIDIFLKKGFYTVGAIRTNRIIYPCNIKQNINAFALFIDKNDRCVRIVTVGKRKFYVYRYEGRLNGIDDAAVLITYPVDAFGDPKALRAFISTDTSLSTDEILDIYALRWQIEVYFRQVKNVLAFDKYQIRSAKGIKRFWLIMSIVYLFCCTADEDKKFTDFSDGFNFFRNEIQKERVTFVYQCGANSVPLDHVLDFAV
jgi:hypothetical protein